MSRVRAFATAALAAALLAGTVAIGRAGPELVQFPAGYRSAGFVEIGFVERPDRSPMITRHFYVNRVALEAARPNQPFPSGTVFVMEDRAVRTGADGQPLRDADGRLVPADTVLAVAVQEKRAGWGAEYPANRRNGEWEYATFDPNGTRRNAPTTACFTCHLNRTGQDFSFYVWRYVIDRAR